MTADTWQRTRTVTGDESNENKSAGFGGLSLYAIMKWTLAGSCVILCDIWKYLDFKKLIQFKEGKNHNKTLEIKENLRILFWGT